MAEQGPVVELQDKEGHVQAVGAGMGGLGRKQECHMDV